MDLLISISIVFAIAVFWLVGAVLLTRFRWKRAVQRRGVGVDEIKRSQGVLIVDYVYGRSIGLGSTVVWWNEATEHPKADRQVSFTSRVVDLPRHQRDLASVKRLFPKYTVLESTTLITPIFERNDREGSNR